MKRIIIKNKYFDRILNDLQYYSDIPCEVMEEDEFIEALPKLDDSIILGYGYELYQKLRELHNSGTIHIGLRNFRYDSFAQLPIVFIGSNRLVFGKYPVRPKDEECDYKQVNGNWVVINPDYKLRFFFSEGPEADPLPLPEVKVVGLKEGLKYIKEFQDDKYKEVPIGLDFESSGFPDDAKFNILGFALSMVDPLQSVYFDYRLDYGYDPSKYNQENYQDLIAFNAEFEKFLDKYYSQVWVFNCKFEIKVLFWMFRKFYEVQDAYALAICDDVKRSLKYDVQYYLHSPSWDDVLDAQMDAIREVFNTNSSFEALKFKIDSNAELTPSEQLVKSDESLMNRMKIYWGDDWSSADPYTMGVYCGYDALYTVYLRNHLWDRYQYCYPIFAYNQYMGCELGLSGITVDVKARRTLSHYYDRVIKNCYAFLNYLYYDNYIKLYGSILDKIEIPDIVKNLIKKSPSLMTGDYIYWGKSFMRLVLDQEQVDRDYKLDPTPINELLGIDVRDELSWLNDWLYDGYASFFRKKSVFYDVSTTIFNLIGVDICQLYVDLNKKAIEPIKDKINSYNNEILSKFPFDYDLKQSIIDRGWLISNPKYTYEEMLSWQPKDMQEKYTREIDNILRNLPDEVYNLMQTYIHIEDDNTFRYEISGWLPAEVLGKEELDTPEKLAYVLNYQGKLDSAPDLSKIKITESDEIPEEEAYGLFNYNSAGDFNTWYQPFAKVYGKDIAIMAMFCEAWNNNSLEIDENNPFDDYIKFRDMANQLDPEKIYNNENYTWVMNPQQTLPQMRECFFWYFPGWVMPPINNETATLDIHLPAEDLFSRVIWYLQLAAVCRKEQSTYIAGITDGAFKPQRYEDTYYMQFDYANSKYDIDSDQESVYTPDFQINLKDTKRWSSGFHTFRQKDDVMMCLRAPEGFLNTYFDISQAEPRSLCYVSRDPLFMDLYDSGKDAYLELAKLAWPDVDAATLKEAYRPVSKTALLAKIYGRSDWSLAEDLGVPESTIKHMSEVMFGAWKKVAELRQHKIDFVEKNGCTETLLGDKMANDADTAYTTAVNYFNQGSTAVILVDGFYNALKKIRESGIEVHPMSVVHDSNTNQIPISKLFECDLIYYRYFRQYCRDKYRIDYKFDLDISINFRDKLSYKFNPNTRICKMSGYGNDVDYILSYLGPCDIKMIKDESEKIHQDRIVDWSLQYLGKSHIICNDPMFIRDRKRSVEFEVRGDIPGIEDWDKPTGTPYYFENVLEWWENTDLKMDMRRNPN